jgi:hypothetical protein
MRSLITFIIALAGITQLSAEQRSDKIVIQGNPAGNQTTQTDAAGLTHVEYSYNDRGRGDHITATWKLDAVGVPTEYEGRGNDYMKAPVEERFDLKNGKERYPRRVPAAKLISAQSGLCAKCRDVLIDPPATAKT